MSLDLDDRQRAMLQEMGVRVWLAPAPTAPVLVTDVRRSAMHSPAPALAVAHEKSVGAALNPAASAPKTSEIRRPDQRVSAPGAAAALANARADTDGVAAMDWPTLARTIAACQACALCSGRRAPVFGAAQAAPQADWLVLGEPPDEAEERLGAPFAGPAGQLLDNMLKALGLSRAGAPGSRASTAYVSNVVKCRPASGRNPEPAELAACENYLRREIALVQPKVILALGRFAAQSLLQGSRPELASSPLGKLRGQIFHYQGIPVLVSYPPSYLLRTQPDKARAWADLCLAQDVLRRGPAGPIA